MSSTPAWLWPYCKTPIEKEAAELSWKRDHPLRSWGSGVAFAAPRHAKRGGVPKSPLALEVKRRGYVGPFCDVPLPYMRRSLLDALTARGWTAYETFELAIDRIDDLVAINVLGKLSRAVYAAISESDEVPTFDSLRARFDTNDPVIDVIGDGPALVFWADGTLAVHRSIAPEHEGVQWTPVRRE
jgi:hypothetical protein